MDHELHSSKKQRDLVGQQQTLQTEASRKETNRHYCLTKHTVQTHRLVGHIFTKRTAPLANLFALKDTVLNYSQEEKKYL